MYSLQKLLVLISYNFLLFPWKGLIICICSKTLVLEIKSDTEEDAEEKKEERRKGSAGNEKGIITETKQEGNADSDGGEEEHDWFRVAEIDEEKKATAAARSNDTLTIYFLR